jgi:hypothetical protein
LSDSDIDEFLSQVGANPQKAARRAQQDAPLSMPEANGDWAKTLAAASCWAQSGSSYFPVSNVVKKIPAGAYKPMVSNQGPYLEKMTISVDHLLVLPDSATEVLLAEFTKFWTLRSEFDSRGFTFKRGMLCWGPPGSGKTSAIWQMTQHLVNNLKGVVLFVEDPQLAIWCINILRRIEPDRPIVTVMEDIDTIIQRYSEHTLLALLDGEFQTDNVVHIATTNYPQLLDKRFVDRPSRFDTIMKVGMPSAAARRMYFSHKEPTLDDETVERWVVFTDGYSVAHLREVIVAIRCFGQPEDEVFRRLDKMREAIKLDSTGEVVEEGQGAGFLARLRR